MPCAPDIITGLRAVVLDVDGVLTDGRIGYGPGDGEIKFFDVRDGHGVVLLRRAGLQVGMLSGRASAANRRRAAELELDFAYEGCKDKLAGFEQLLQEQGLTAAQCLMIGDDLVDIPVMRRAGADVGADGRVRLPRGLVERARSGAPSVVPVFDRSGGLAMELGGYNSYFGTGSDLMSTYDLESG